MVVLGQKHKAGDDDKQCACHSFLNPFLKPIGLDLFKKGKEKVRIRIRNRLSIFINKKMQKNALKTYLFLTSMHDCTHASIHIDSFCCLSVMRRRRVKKGGSLIEKWFFSCTK